MINVLVIVNDQPYGSERPYNALRLAGSLAKADDVALRVFLLGDAVGCAVAGQQPSCSRANVFVLARPKGQADPRLAHDDRPELRRGAGG